MKKILIILATLFAFTFTVVSCTEKETVTEVLEAPVLNEPTTTETSFTISWEAVEGAVNYTYMINGENTTETTELTVTVENLERGEYDFRVRANAENPEYNSKFTKATIKIGAGIDAFYGNYTVTAGSKLIMGEEAIEQQEIESTYDITIAEFVDQEGNPSEEIASITGWISEAITFEDGELIPVPAWYDLQIDEEGNTLGHKLAFINQVTLTAPDPEGWAGTTLTCGEVDQNGETGLYFISGQFVAYVIEATENGLDFVPQEAGLQGGGSFMPIQYYMYALNSEGYVNTYEPEGSVAGPYSAVKTTSTKARTISQIRTQKASMKAALETPMKIEQRFDENGFEINTDVD